MNSVLERIFAAKKIELQERQREVPLRALESQVLKASSPRDFIASLKAHKPAIIAEIKRASPSKGDIFATLDPAAVAREYAEAGAAAISVLTDRHFKGSLDDLRRVRETTELPILRKDFIFDYYQLLEARAAGADCVLLIVAMLDEAKLKSLVEQTHELGMTALVEVHTAEELQVAQRIGARLIGINNRNLHTFETNLSVTERLLRDYRPSQPVVSESGINNARDIQRVVEAGACAVLVGEGLLRNHHPGRELRTLIAGFREVLRPTASGS